MDLQTAAYHIAHHYFRPPPGKPVAIASEPGKLELARALGSELERLGHRTILPVLEGEPAALRQALERLLEDESFALALFASPSMWADLGLKERLTFRDRQPSLEGKPDPLFFDAATPLDSLIRLYSADPQAMAGFLQGLQRNLDDNAAVHLTTPGGTDLHFTSRRWQPWGWEMMTCPVEDSAEGVIAVDAAVFFSRINQPFELTVANGRLTGMTCPDRNDAVFRQYRQWMMEAMEENPDNARLAEVGLGANPNAQIGDIVMESEAARGTVHVCFGDNAQFAGMGGENRTGWHGGTVILEAPRFEKKQAGQDQT